MAITIWVDASEIIDWLEELRGKVYERIKEEDTRRFYNANSHLKKGGDNGKFTR